MKRAIKIGKVVGPYSPAIETERKKQIYVSGQIATDLDAADIKIQTQQVIQKIENILNEVDAYLSDVVKTTIYLVDINDFAIVNEEYAKSFPYDPPARATLQVAALPLGAQVMIEAIATRD
ncbi:MAG: RidA family protein [Candidatus Hodarchaeales archaeon]|jgi:2-iminobutanoate/2-iminopropanoate deaminase